MIVQVLMVTVLPWSRVWLRDIVVVENDCDSVVIRASKTDSRDLILHPHGRTRKQVALFFFFQPGPRAGPCIDGYHWGIFLFSKVRSRY